MNIDRKLVKLTSPPSNHGEPPNSWRGRTIKILLYARNLISEIFRKCCCYLLELFQGISRTRPDQVGSNGECCISQTHLQPTKQHGPGLPTEGTDCFTNAVNQSFVQAMQYVLEIEKKLCSLPIVYESANPPLNGTKVFTSLTKNVTVDPKHKTVFNTISDNINELFRLMMNSVEIDTQFKNNLKKLNKNLRDALNKLSPKFNLPTGSFCDATEYFGALLDALDVKPHPMWDTDQKHPGVFQSLIVYFPANRSEKTEFKLSALLKYKILPQKKLNDQDLPVEANSNPSPIPVVEQIEKLKEKCPIPLIIPIQLSRYGYDNTYTQHKIFNPVVAEKTIQLEIEDNDATATYKLISAVVHYGPDINSKHYVAYKLAPDGSYIQYNDNNVYLCTDSAEAAKDVANNGYLFFYVLDNIEKRQN